MKRHTLREVAKVAIGLVIADLLSTLWLSSAGFFPLAVLGITWSASAVLPIVIFDLSLIILLAHYSYHMKLPISSPRERMLLLIAGSVFLLVAILHLVRIAFGWEIILGTVVLPVWISWLGVILPGYLAYSSYHFALRTKH